jgi:NAD(P)H dehydrogenase (quinone)
MKLKVYFYSTYGHNYLMAKAAAEGATDAGAEVELKRFPETIPAAVLKDMGADQAQKAFADVPELGPQDFADADGFIIVSATRFGNVPGQVQNILDQTGSQWATQSLEGKVGSAIVGTATQHGGQEAALFSLHRYFLHQGMVVAGLPYTFQGQMGTDEITGGSPYGAGTIAGGDGSRMPSDNELAAARFQGKRTAELAGKLAG